MFNSYHGRKGGKAKRNEVFYPFKTSLITIVYWWILKNLKRWLNHGKQSSVCLCSPQLNIIYLGEQASLHHTYKTPKIHSHPNLQSHSPTRLKRLVWQSWNYLKYDWTKWKSRCQVCTLVQVQLKLNLKPEYWQRVKYKMLSFFKLFFFFTHFQTFSTLQLLHH